MVHEIAAYVARDRDKYERELVASRRRLEELVTEAKRLHAEARDRALFAKQMLGIVSHALRNPVSSIAMGAAVLARGGLTDSQQRTLSRISRSTDRANRLIADLLDFTKARLGGAGAPLNLTSCSDDTTVSVAVHNLGVPIAEDVQRRIFQLMTRGTDAASPADCASARRNLRGAFDRGGGNHLPRRVPARSLT